MMAVVEIELVQCICDKCGHVWHPREGTLPAICSKCKTKYWNRGARTEPAIPALSSDPSQIISEIEERLAHLRALIEV